MVAIGRVIGGDYLNGLVSTPAGSTILVQTGVKFKKLTSDSVAEWDEVVSDGKGGAVSAVGRAVVGAARAGHLGKVASAAVSAAIDSRGSSHVVRIDWSDGRLSLIKMPDPMFRHLELILKERRAAPVEAARAAGATSSPTGWPTAAEQAFSIVSGMVKDRFATRSASTPPVHPQPAQSQPAQSQPVQSQPVQSQPAQSQPVQPPHPAPTAQPDIVEQIMKLASLHDAGILTDEEFTTKKAELLARL